MPPQVPAFQSQSQSAEDQPPQPRMSRRSLLRGAAVGGTAGVILAGGSAAVVDYLHSSKAGASTAAKPVVVAPVAPAAMDGPMIVYLRNTTSGDLSFFAGDGQVQVHDPALVARLVQAMK
jgi:TctA family transporter